MTRKTAPPTGRKATPNDVGTNVVCQLSATAYRYAFDAEGASIRDAAEWLGVSATTVQRLLAKGERVTALRSRRLARHYLVCLARLAREAEREGGHARSHDQKISRSRGSRKSAKGDRRRGT